jgi:cytochrome P450
MEESSLLQTNRERENDWSYDMSNEQDVKTPETQQEEILPFPFPFADHSLQCPAEYGRLQQECPVARVHMPYGGDAFLLTRYADVAKVFTDPNCGVIQHSDGDVPRLEAGEVIGGGSEGESLFTVSDARHNQVRRRVTQAFTVQAANKLRPRVVEVTNALVDAIERSGPPADLFEDYAIQTPISVICEILGVPAKDEMLFRAWGKSVISTTSTPQEKQEQSMKMVQYMTPIIEQERAHPRENVLSLLVKAREQGDEAMTQGEMFSFAMGLIAAGFETVSTTFTNSAFIILQRPELMAQLSARVDEPERLASAIEEILRITPIGPGRPRITRGEVKLSETTIPAGEVLFLSPLSANYDESAFPHAREVDFDRQAANPILSFGRGIHACLGQQVARMELQVLWSTLLKRLPTIRLAVAPSEVPWREGDALTFGPAHLPVTW